MKIDLKTKINNTLNIDSIIVEIEYPLKNNIDDLVNYIKKYETYSNTVIVSNEDYTMVEIKYDDILLFYSNKKNNYCKTKEGIYKIKSKLYEIEQENINFIRISKSCIVNINHVIKFDFSETGKIIIVLDDLSEEIVSRRKTRDIMKYLDNRRI